MRHHDCLNIAGGLAALLLAAAATPAATAASGTSLVSVGPGGVQGNSGSDEPSVSGDGSAIAFRSTASNLVPGDTNGALDIFVRDRRAGRTSLVSAGLKGAPADGVSTSPLISRDGRRVAFLSSAGNLVAGDTNGRDDVFVRDLRAGTTVRASVGNGGVQLDDVGGLLAISADARLVAFLTVRTERPGPGRFALLTRDLRTGTTTVESRNAQGRPANGSFIEAALSADGRYLAFTSDATNLVPGVERDLTRLYLKDRKTGAFSLVDVTPDGRPSASAAAVTVAISADGRFVAFASSAQDLVAGGPTSGVAVPYVRDVETGRTTRLAITPGNAEPDGTVLVDGISADGRYVVLQTNADLLPGDHRKGSGDVFVHDRRTGRTSLVSGRPSGAFADFGNSGGGAISADGGTVAFASNATQLVVGDANKAADVFARATPRPAAGAAR